MTNNQVKGLLWASLTTLISGVAVFANSLVVKGIDPMVYTTVKNGFVGIIMVLILVYGGEWKTVRKLKKQQVVKLLLIALVGGSLSFALFFTGLKMIGGAQGAIIHKTLIFWIALMAVPLLKEKISLKMGAGIMLLYFSNFVVGFGGFSELSLGHGMILLATILWAIESVIAKVTLRDVSANIVVAARMSVGSIILLGILVALGKAPLVGQLTGMQWLMLMGVSALLLGYVMSWYRALKLAPATQVAGVLVGASVITNLLKTVFVTHAFGLTQVLQAVVIVTGVWFVVMSAMDGWLISKKPALK